MNLPNKLTLIRIVLILPFLAVLYAGIPFASYIALAIFIIASASITVESSSDPSVNGLLKGDQENIFTLKATFSFSVETTHLFKLI